MQYLSLRRPSSPINATVHIPGSKSYTNRALILAALAEGTSTLTHASMSADSHALIAALRHLGCRIEMQRAPRTLNPEELEITVKGGNGSRSSYNGTIDVGPAGTTMRFLTAFCAAATPRAGSDRIELRGSARMHARPIAPLVAALRTMGASIEYLGNEGCPPLAILRRSQLQGGEVTIDGSISSQFTSALLMIAPLAQEAVSLQITGTILSQSYIEMTLQSMLDFGVQVERIESQSGHHHFNVHSGQKYLGKSYAIEGDASGASYLWGLAAVSGGVVTTTNVRPDSAQGDVQFPRLLEQMGCTVSTTSNSVTVRGSSNLRGIEVDMSTMPDTAQTLATVAACAKGTTIIRGLSTLRIKETDRIAALHKELLKMGIQCEEGSDFIVVHGGEPKPARIATYDDHRMAMSFAVLAGAVDGIQIEEPTVVEKSFPSFWETLRESGVGVIG